MQVTKKADGTAIRLPRDKNVRRRRLRDPFRSNRVPVLIDGLEVPPVEAEIRFVLTRKNRIGLRSGRDKNAPGRKCHELTRRNKLAGSLVQALLLQANRSGTASLV